MIDPNSILLINTHCRQIFVRKTNRTVHDVFIPHDISVQIPGNAVLPTDSRMCDLN